MAGGRANIGEQNGGSVARLDPHDLVAARVPAGELHTHAGYDVGVAFDELH